MVETLLTSQSQHLGQRVVWNLRPRHAGDDVDVIRLQSGGNVVGRGDDCHVQLDAFGIADRHCTILVGSQRTIVQAHDARTWINDGAVTENRLRAGDHLVVGPLEFLVEQVTEVVVPPAAEIRPERPAPTPRRVRGVPYSPPDIDELLSEVLGEELPQTEVRFDATRRKLEQKEQALAQRELDLAQRLAKVKSVEQAWAKRVLEVEDQLSELDRFHGELAERATVVSRHHRKILAEQKELRKQTASHQVQESKLLSLREELQKHERELVQQREQLDALTANVHQRENELTSQLQSLKDREQSVQAQESELNSKAASVEEKLRELEVREAELTDRSNLLQAELRELESRREEIARTLAELKEQEERYAGLEARAAELSDRETEIQNKADSVNELKSQLEQENSALREEISELQSQLVAQNQTHDDQEAERAGEFVQREASVKQKERDLLARQTELDIQSEALQQQRVELEQQQKLLRQERNKFQEEYRSWSNDVGFKEEMLCQREERCQELEEELEDELHRAHQAPVEVSEESAELATQLSTLEQQQRELEEFRQQLEAREAKLIEPEDAGSAVDPALQAELESLREQLNLRDHELNEREEELEARLQKLTEQEQDLGIRQELQSKIELLTQELADVLASQEANSQALEDQAATEMELQEQLEKLEQQRQQFAEEQDELILERQEYVRLRQELEDRQRFLEEQSEGLSRERRTLEAMRSDLDVERIELQDRALELKALQDSLLEADVTDPRGVAEITHEELSELETDLQDREPESNEPEHLESTNPGDGLDRDSIAELLGLSGEVEVEAPLHDVDDTSGDDETSSSKSVADSLMGMLGSLGEHAAESESIAASESSDDQPAKADESHQLRSELASLFGIGAFDEDQGEITEEYVESSLQVPEEMHEEEPELDEEPVAEEEEQPVQAMMPKTSILESNEEVTVSSYMDDLLARMRQSASPVAQPETSTESDNQEELEDETESQFEAQEDPVVDENENFQNLDEVFREQYAKEQTAPKKLNDVDKETIRANLDSFRQVANHSARTAVVTSRVSRNRARLEVVGIAAAISWILAICLVISSLLYSSVSVMTGIIATGLALLVSGYGGFLMLDVLRSESQISKPVTSKEEHADVEE